MSRVLRICCQFVVIAGLFTAVAAFADWPVYRQTPPGTGIVMLSFVHGADRSAPCRRLSPQEIAKLPPNMRRLQDCPRGRRPVYVELDIGDKVAYRAALPPTGIAGDGPARVYQRFVLPAGPYDLAVRMRDTARTDGFDYQKQLRIALAPDQMFVIDFRAEPAGFVFK